MFAVGKSYRVKLTKGDNFVIRQGEMVSFEDDFLVLDIEGVHTGFHLRSGSFAYVELMDKDAEKTRDKARADRYVKALT